MCSFQIVDYSSWLLQLIHKCIFSSCSSHSPLLASNVLWPCTDLTCLYHAILFSLLFFFTCCQSQPWHKSYRAFGWIIPLTHRCGARNSAIIFWGSDLVSWLVEVGLSSDRGEAVKYGERLLKGGIIQHITDEYEFRDENLYYRMMKTRRVPYQRRWHICSFVYLFPLSWILYVLILVSNISEDTINISTLTCLCL